MSDNLYSWFPRALVIGAAVVGLSSLPARAQQITDPSPAQAATNVEPTSPISASFRSQDGVSVRPETVRVFLDGQDVTSQSVITRDFFTYRPAQPLPPGRREVLLVVEAKKDDLTRAFVQMAVEMIALAQVEQQAQIYGAVTMGSIWQFGQILAHQQMIKQDLTLYRVPEELETIAGILTAMVSNPSQS
jgi:hypothetical protein